MRRFILEGSGYPTWIVIEGVRQVVYDLVKSDKPFQLRRGGTERCLVLWSNDTPPAPDLKFGLRWEESK